MWDAKGKRYVGRRGVLCVAGLARGAPGQFDTDEYLLGLPGGLVVYLRVGNARPMWPEDYISRCRQ